MAPEPPITEPQNPPGLHRAGSAYVLIYALLIGLLVVTLVQRYFRPLVLSDPITVQTTNVPAPSLAEPDSTLESRIDPNTADWAELTYLPRIGEAIAKRIVAYRQAHAPPASQGDTRQPVSVFTCPEDLTAISGIGPKTVERIAPYLRFPGTDAALGR